MYLMYKITNTRIQLTLCRIHGSYFWSFRSQRLVRMLRPLKKSVWRRAINSIFHKGLSPYRHQRTAGWRIVTGTPVFPSWIVVAPTASAVVGSFGSMFVGPTRRTTLRFILQRRVTFPSTNRSWLWCALPSFFTKVHSFNESGGMFHHASFSSTIYPVLEASDFVCRYGCIGFGSSFFIDINPFGIVPVIFGEFSLGNPAHARDREWKIHCESRFSIGHRMHVTDVTLSFVFDGPTSWCSALAMKCSIRLKYCIGHRTSWLRCLRIQKLLEQNRNSANRLSFKKRSLLRIQTNIQASALSQDTFCFTDIPPR